MNHGFVYIMANNRPTLYTGMTNNLVRRVYQHKHAIIGSGFTARYRLHKLVYYESLPTIKAAIIREKQIKDMNRAAKIQMIQQFNPTLRDLYSTILESSTLRSESPE